MSKFLEQVHLSISGFAQNVIYYDLKLSQKMADHHHFSFVWKYSGKTIIQPEDQAKATAKFMGNEVIFTFNVNGIKLMSKGRIKKLNTCYKLGSPVGLHVEGISHTVVLDEMKKSRTFLGKNLQEIALELFSEDHSGEFYQREAIRPTYTKALKYKAQYNESSFDFMKRISARYGQWLYFDGMRMQFGQTKTSNVKLINGASLHEFKIETNLVSHKTSFGGYDYNAAANIRNESDKTTRGSGDSFAGMVRTNQRQITGADLSVGAYTNNAQNKDEINEMVKLQTAGRDANSVFYGGISYFPIGLGQVFTIQNVKVEHQLVAIEIIHHSNTNGNYTCEFKAIPADVAAPHYTDVEAYGRAEAQPAKVVDNNDPEGLGRVKVEFFWTGGKTTSEWMRVMQQYSGKGGGIYWRPEVDDEVLVGFENSNIDYPYVMGSHYNGQAKPDFFDPNNDLKGTRTRSGIENLSNDANGSWKQSTPDGNFILFDGEGNAVLNVPKKFTVNAADIEFNVGQNMNTTVGMNILESAGADKTTDIKGKYEITVQLDFFVTVWGQMVEYIKGNKESRTEKDRTRMSNGKMVTQSQGAHEQHSDKQIKNNSGEQTGMN